jgi:hypothetical protein
MSDVIVGTYRTGDGNLGVMFKSDYVYRRKTDGQTMAQIILDNDDLVTLAIRPIPRDEDKTIAQIAAAMWEHRKEDEDRCDIEISELSKHHSIWKEARAAYEVMFLEARL